MIRSYCHRKMVENFLCTCSICQHEEALNLLASLLEVCCFIHFETVKNHLIRLKHFSLPCRCHHRCIMCLQSYQSQSLAALCFYCLHTSHDEAIWGTSGNIHHPYVQRNVLKLNVRRNLATSPGFTCKPSVTIIWSKAEQSALSWDCSNTSAQAARSPATDWLLTAGNKPS